eukprot:1608972-Rhodomonas_salina.4
MHPPCNAHSSPCDVSSTRPTHPAAVCSSVRHISARRGAVLTQPHPRTGEERGRSDQLPLPCRSRRVRAGVSLDPDPQLSPQPEFPTDFASLSVDDAERKFDGASQSRDAERGCGRAGAQVGRGEAGGSRGGGRRVHGEVGALRGGYQHQPGQSPSLVVRLHMRESRSQCCCWSAQCGAQAGPSCLSCYPLALHTVVLFFSAASAALFQSRPQH